MLLGRLKAAEIGQSLWLEMVHGGGAGRRLPSTSQVTRRLGEFVRKLIGEA